jgi:tryptophan synthase alpha chain
LGRAAQRPIHRNPQSEIRNPKSEIPMSRISDRFADLKRSNRKGFVAFLTAGDPDMDATRRLVLELERRGVDILELGVPFSDPLADGPVIQEASQRALARGASMGGILNLVADLRRETELPIVLFTYYNPVHSYGLERFGHDLRAVGADGLLVLDLPPEEAKDYKRVMDGRQIDTIFLLTPTSRDGRIRLVSEFATGFIYYVSRTGVTGERDRLDAGIGPTVDRIRKVTNKPVAVGFGISSPEQTREAARHADAVVVGSAIVRCAAAHAGESDMVARVGRFVETLTQPLRGDA